MRLGLEEGPADAGEVLGGGVGDLAGGGDGIAVIGLASGQERRLDDRIVAFDEFLGHEALFLDRDYSGYSAPFLKTVMAAGSGQA